jgi:hypothetical protein
VLQAELAGLAAAAEACRNATEDGSPWSKHTPSSSTGGKYNHSWEEGVSEGDGAGLRMGEGGTSSGRGVSVEQQGLGAAAAAKAATAAEAGSKGSNVADKPMQVIGFFQ